MTRGVARGELRCGGGIERRSLDVKRQPDGKLNGMPAFLGCSDQDPHIPLQRVKETTALLEAMGASVTEKIYPKMGHTVIEDEIERAREIISQSL